MEEETGPTLEGLRELLSEWKTLVESKGWKRLAALGEVQRNARLGPIVRQSTQELVDVFKREYGLGEIAGIDLFLSIPSTEIDRLTEEIENLEPLEEEINEDELAP